MSIDDPRHSRAGGNPGQALHTLVFVTLDSRLRGNDVKWGVVEKTFYVYILASERNGTLYVGMTSNLARRMYEHKEGALDGFSKEYRVKQLVHYEVYERAEDAIHREKCLKKWNRAWKLEMIEAQNPQWKDLHETLNQ